MKTTKLILIVSVFLMSSNLFCQEQNNNEEVNKVIWKKFTKAFETYDVELFASLHSEDFVRISGNSKTIRNVENYIAGYRNRWQATSRKQTIAFRFTERINNGTLASEKGIYKLSVNPETPEEASYYGAFHVVMRKEENTWKLLIDYDSNPNNSINEESFLNAKPK